MASVLASPTVIAHFPPVDQTQAAPLAAASTSAVVATALSHTITDTKVIASGMSIAAGQSESNPQVLSLSLRWEKKKLTNEDLSQFFLNSTTHEFPSLNSLFLMHRHLEAMYRNLPWPQPLNRVTLMTKVFGGRGDVAAAAKVIQVMQNINPDLIFDWIPIPYPDFEPKSFLNCPNPSNVHIWKGSDERPKNSLFLIVGPVKCNWDNADIERRIAMKIDGPRFSFMEIAEEPSHQEITDLYVSSSICQETSDDQLKTLYPWLHKRFFRSQSPPLDGLQMGLKEGIGIFVDEERLNAPLSREYCCPRYLKQLRDDRLRKDILDALDVREETHLPNYDRYSFNSGYAHHSTSWGKFIDFVAIHERVKHVILVLNQYGQYEKHNKRAPCFT